MARRKKPALSSRKQPQQERSERMVADILEASIRVLRREGALRFTTVRVAEEAGVSVGSLYQYFPNKGALLFRLQRDEWAATFTLLDGLLFDLTRPPVERLRRAIQAFFRTEQEEAALRRALSDASALFEDAPEVQAHQARAQARVQQFFGEALPHRAPTEVAFLTDFFLLALGAIAEKVTDRKPSPGELERWTAATVELLCAHLERLQRPAG
ncbi:TetR family transcriptional regulator [Melittangium boletus]|uniref:TetR family transcriptional regulator n=1 Tax=Melittangium boletus TaxID=83453 RepID=UPI003DA41F59